MEKYQIIINRLFHEQRKNECWEMAIMNMLPDFFGWQIEFITTQEDYDRFFDMELTPEEFSQVLELLKLSP